ncbi:hypothetical protein Nepgr_028160 [Nepenthes gracilis]|uniref:Uncharacterized protein n=1 Tax=Nepenthes gracilis TaxID=150966 RepID=A0AAD3TBF2_NEPGR|nr:hypothetical protein Nepgr_028160 [Nepenthes gracilis]
MIGDIGAGFLLKNQGNDDKFLIFLFGGTVEQTCKAVQLCSEASCGDLIDVSFDFALNTTSIAPTLVCCQSDTMTFFMEFMLHVVAYLQQILRFEVGRAVNFPFPPDIYALSFRLQLGRFSKKTASPDCCLDEAEQDYINGCLKCRSWIDYKLAEFIVSCSEPATQVCFSMKQINSTHSKLGLCEDSASIVPSYLREQRKKIGFKAAIIDRLLYCKLSLHQ